jgi:hypothetical protein
LGIALRSLWIPKKIRAKCAEHWYLLVFLVSRPVPSWRHHPAMERPFDGEGILAVPDVSGTSICSPSYAAERA